MAWLNNQRSSGIYVLALSDANPSLWRGQAGGRIDHESKAHARFDARRAACRLLQAGNNLRPTIRSASRGLACGRGGKDRTENATLGTDRPCQPSGNSLCRH